MKKLSLFILLLSFLPASAWAAGCAGTGACYYKALDNSELWSDVNNWWTGTGGTGFIKEFLPEANYVNIASNGTSSVTLLSADAAASIVVDTFTIINADAVPYTIYLCNGACSTANWIPFEVKEAGQGGRGATNVRFSGTKNTLIAFKCATNCTTHVTGAITYHKIKR